MDNGNEITDRNEIANGFSNLFVNVGPVLARNITNNGQSDVHEYMKESNINAMYSNNVDKKEIIDIVNSCESKNSKDHNEFSMSI